MNKFTVAILVNNQAGVLNRVTSMFRRRQFNIISVTVGVTEVFEYARITIQALGDDQVKQQLINQLYKLPDVHTVMEFDPDETVTRELLLIKVVNTADSRSAINACIDAYEGKIVDYTKDSIMIQMVGDTRKNNNFIKLMQDFEILEICRTGIVALERGNVTIERYSLI